ncbi:Dynactin subunit 4 [Smittium culicis]|uniref:Dynactin subunit 4 n=1 Tax=Smittium culicis TaxID=133412 RepID=A0A1R1YQH8_9FUNG|nr:Dynactin subunit 4 [Smittium culicis]OMJ29105.1 Dynactin subunit 4 [Smittium culicis]
MKPSSVFYMCSCTTNSISDSKLENLDPDILRNYISKVASQNDFPTKIHTLSQLYYCNDCKEIKCSSCTFIEPQVYYCPKCLFEVPSASVRSENNFCGRNCYGCPVCGQYLIVSDGNLPNDPNSKNMQIDSQNTENNFRLQCTVCAWDSREIGWSFSRPTGQISDLKEPDQLKEEFDNLVSYFQTIQKQQLNDPLDSLAERNPFGYDFNWKRQRIQNYGANNGFFGEKITRKIASLRSFHNNDDPALDSENFGIKPYSTNIYTTEDLELLNKVSNIKNGNIVIVIVFTLFNSVNFLHSHLPLEKLRKSKIPCKTHLDLKVSKRCRKCNHVITKPESKSQSLRLKFNKVALKHVPSITFPIEFAPKYPIFNDFLLIPPGSSVHKYREFLMPVRFTNPNIFPIDVSVHSIDQQVKIYPENFTLKAHFDQWDYDDDEDAIVDDLELQFGLSRDSYKETLATSENLTTLPTQNKFDELQILFRENMHANNGVLSRRNDSCLILLGISPDKVVSGFNDEQDPVASKLQEKVSFLSLICF